jgi:hypothetical protein
MEPNEAALFRRLLDGDKGAEDDAIAAVSQQLKALALRHSKGSRQRHEIPEKGDGQLKLLCNCKCRFCTALQMAKHGAWEAARDVRIYRGTDRKGKPIKSLWGWLVAHAEGAIRQSGDELVFFGSAKQGKNRFALDAQGDLVITERRKAELSQQRATTIRTMLLGSGTVATGKPMSKYSNAGSLLSRPSGARSRSWILQLFFLTLSETLRILGTLAPALTASRGAV